MAPAMPRDAKQPGSRWRSPLRSIFFRARKSSSHVRNIGRQVAPRTTVSQVTTILVSVTSATTIAPTSTTILATDMPGTDKQLSVEPSRTSDTGSSASDATTEASSLALPFQGAAQLPATTTIDEPTDPTQELPIGADSQNESVSPATTTDTELAPASKSDTGAVGTLRTLNAVATSPPAEITGLPEQTSFSIDGQSTFTITTPSTSVLRPGKTVFIPPTEITPTTVGVITDSSLTGAIPIETSTAEIIPSSDHSAGLDAPPATTKLSLTDDSDVNQSTVTTVEPTVAPFTGTANVLFNTPVSAVQESTSSAPDSGGPNIDTRTPGVLVGGSSPTSASIASDSVAPTASSDGTLLPSDPSVSPSSTDSPSAGATGGLLTTSVEAETTIISPTASANSPSPSNASTTSPKSSNKGTIIAAVVGVIVALGFGLMMILIVRRLRRTQFVKSMSTPFTQAPEKRSSVMSRAGLIRRSPNWMFESPPETPHPSRTRLQSRRSTWHTRRTSTSTVGSGFDDAIQAIPVH